MNVEVKPLVGPNSILLALMASGMNGQQFKFNGYLPIKDPERNKAIKELESESAKKNCTQIFIETPYRNNQLIDALLSNCQPSTKICIAVDITSDKEFIKTKTLAIGKGSNLIFINGQQSFFYTHLHKPGVKLSQTTVIKTSIMKKMCD
jgi:Predicted methyltransferases